MFRYAFACLVFCFGLISTLSAEEFDAEADQEILDCISSDEFFQDLVEYQYGEYVYDIYILHNPLRLPLWTENFEWTPDWSLAMIADLPFELIAHIKELVPALERERDDFYIDLRGYGEMWDGYLLELKPVHVATAIVDAENDAAVQKVFSSTDFENKVFHYKLDGKPYMVRVLHNPMGKTLSATREWYFGKNDPEPYTIYWSYRYGIFTDKRAPQALIDHLSRFVQCSWWSWYYNFHVSNGTAVRRSIHRGYIIDDYILDPWFYYTSDLK